MFKRIELAANIVIIIVAVLLGVVLIRVYLLPKSQAPQPNPSSISPGAKLSITGVDFKANGKTLVLALSTTCHFCTESAPFYQRVAQARATVNLRLVAVFPQPVVEARAYLTKLGVSVDDVKQAPLDSIGVAGTPTLIMANDQGAVIRSWRGSLPPEKEDETLALLK